MSYTYDTLVSDIIANLEEDSAEFVDAIPTIVARAQEYLQRRIDAVNFNRVTTVSISASVRTVDLPSDVLVLKSVQVSSSTGWTNLLLQTNEYLTAYWPNYTSCAEPKYYGIIDNTQIFLAPTPIVDQAASLEYVALVTTLSSTEPTNWFSSRAGAAFFAAAMMYANIWTKNGAATTQWKALVDEELMAINNEARRTRRSDALDRNDGSPENNLGNAP